jgi:hypothetical protein
MAASGFTPISLYYSTTASAAPTSGNLVAGELALNTLDEKLYFKNSAGTVKLLASNAASTGTVSSVAASVPAFLSVAGSPITTSGTLAITLSGTALPVANGGTGLTTTPANGALDIGNGTGFTRTTLTAGTGVTITNASGAITINATGTGGTVTSVAATVPSFLSITGSPITTSGTLAFSLSGTALPTTSGGTGLTSFTSGGVVYASSSSALATGSALTFDGTNLGVGANITASSSGAPALTVGTGSGAPSITLYSATNSASQISFADATTGSGAYDGYLLYNQLVQNMVFGVAATEGMRLTSTGLGIGIAPTTKLDVYTNSATTYAARIYNNNAYGGLFLQTSSTSSSTYNLACYNSAAYLFVVRDDGNVGIGTSSPTQKLDVSGSGVVSARIASTSSNATLILSAPSAFFNYLQYSSAGSSGLIFYDTTNSANRMVLDASGNVGIGTSSPSYAVDIKLTANNTLRVGSVSNSLGTLLQWNNDSGYSRVTSIGGYPLDLGTNETTRFRIGDSGQFGIGGSTYGTAGQVLTSGGASAAPTWSTPAGGGSQAFVAFGSTGGL